MKKLSKLLTVLVSATMVMGVSGCGQPGAPSGGSSGSAAVHTDTKANDDAKCRNTVKYPKAEKVTLWSWYPQVGKLIDHFNESHKDVQVCWTSGDQSAKAYSRFNTAIKAKSGAADIVQLEYAVMPQFASGVEKHLVDLTQFGANKIKNDYTPGSWKDVQLGGDKGVYGVPVDVGPVVMYYRKDIFDKYGVNVPTTWAEYEQAGRELKAKGYQGHIGNWQPNGTLFNYAYYAQKGAQVFKYSANDPEKVGINFNSSEVKDVVSFWQKLAKDDIVSTDDTDTAEWNKKNVDGSYATIIHASWMVGYLSGLSGVQDGSHWQVAKAPVWKEGDPAINCGGSALAVTDQAKDTKLAAKVAMDFFADDGAQQIAVNDSGLYPTWKKKLNDPEFMNRREKFFDDQKINEIVAPVAKAYTGYQFVPFQTYANDEQTKTLSAILRDGKDVGGELDALQKTLTDYAKQQGFTTE
ncbi:ABC transporter substrate-binding protein [Bifidobacterium bombi]|uniref:ABC transporter, solute-binding protein n=1 Tax=Bifidobacterium bombi DSM 19703 TaxID=1341695 RepID=A0A086BP87_9BIFI|nr:extracellular solute-binding protein [Bifidobacterium bombi]KFF30751.1 ABC transporter, solute-binding protein [Bifidobacterium bombi DSM 19703]